MVNEGIILIGDTPASLSRRVGSIDKAWRIWNAEAHPGQKMSRSMFRKKAGNNPG